MSFFCKQCFECYHPWYRVVHLFTDIANDEHIQHTLKVSHRIAEAGRYEREGKDMMQHLQVERERLQFVADDSDIDDKMRVFGRSVLVLEDHVSVLRARLQKDIYGPAQNEVSVPVLNGRSRGNNHSNYSNHTNTMSNASSSLMELSKHARTESNVSQFSAFTWISEEDPDDDRSVRGPDLVAVRAFSSSFDLSARPSDGDEPVVSSCVRIQRVFKGYLARMAVSVMMAARVMRVWSPDAARGEYLCLSACRCACRDGTSNRFLPRPGQRRLLLDSLQGEEPHCASHCILLTFCSSSWRATSTLFSTPPSQHGWLGGPARPGQGGQSVVCALLCVHAHAGDEQLASSQPQWLCLYSKASRGACWLGVTLFRGPARFSGACGTRTAASTTSPIYALEKLLGASQRCS